MDSGAVLIQSARRAEPTTHARSRNGALRDNTMTRSAIALALLTAAPAAAQVTPIAPFAGHAADDFETQTPGVAGACVEGRVFQDQANLCTPLNNGATIATSWTFLCTLLPRRGEQFYGSSEGRSVYRFDRRVRRFGGFFASNAPGGVVTVRFIDSGGSVIDEVTANVPSDCTWRWNGWEAPEAIIKRVQVESSANEGAFVMMDDMRIDFAEIDMRYCEGAPNSTGEGARIAATGTTSVQANNLTLVSSGQPWLSTGLFFYGGATSQVPLGDGFRCVASGGSGVQRLPLDQADVLATMRTVLDHDAIINPPTQIMPGSTWHFQAMYRDPAAGGNGVNLSDAITLTFAP